MIPNNLCPLCGHDITVVTGAGSVAVGKRVVNIFHERFVCDGCGEEFYTPDQAQTAQFEAANKIRDEAGLLRPDEILAIRKSLGLSQAAFERLLGTGRKTVVRWERGTVCQSSSSNTLLQVLQRDRSLALILAEIHGVSITREMARFVSAAKEWIELESGEELDPKVISLTDRLTAKGKRPPAIKAM